MSGGSTAFVRKQKAELARQRDRDLRAKARARLRELRAAIRAAREARRAGVRAVEDLCRANRSSYREQIRNARAELARLITEKRAEARRCAVEPGELRRKGDAMILAAVQALAEERQLQAELKRWDRKRAPKLTISEKRSESDDEVRRNLDPELGIVWEKVKGEIKPGRASSRTEAFLHWVHENPADVSRIIAEHAEEGAEQKWREMLEEEQRIARALKKKGRAQSRALEALEEVPF